MSSSRHTFIAALALVISIFATEETLAEVTYLVCQGQNTMQASGIGALGSDEENRSYTLNDGEVSLLKGYCQIVSPAQTYCSLTIPLNDKNTGALTLSTIWNLDRLQAVVSHSETTHYDAQRFKQMNPDLARFFVGSGPTIAVANLFEGNCRVTTPKLP